MTIRSVDMQVLVQKSGEVSRIQQNQRMDHIHRQQDSEGHIVKQTFELAKQIKQTQRGETSYVDEKQEKKERKPKKDEYKPEKENESRQDIKLDDVNKPEGSNLIDIKI